MEQVLLRKCMEQYLNLKFLGRRLEVLLYYHRHLPPKELQTRLKFIGRLWKFRPPRHYNLCWVIESSYWPVHWWAWRGLQRDPTYAASQRNVPNKCRDLISNRALFHLLTGNWSDCAGHRNMVGSRSVVLYRTPEIRRAWTDPGEISYNQVNGEIIHSQVAVAAIRWDITLISLNQDSRRAPYWTCLKTIIIDPIKSGFAEYHIDTIAFISIDWRVLCYQRSFPFVPESNQDSGWEYISRFTHCRSNEILMTDSMFSNWIVHCA